jgi:hypothetical protein
MILVEPVTERPECYIVVAFAVTAFELIQALMDTISTEWIAY